MKPDSLEKLVIEHAAFAESLAQRSGVEPSAVKAVITAFEMWIVTSLYQGSGGSFTFPGLFRLCASHVPAGTLADAHPFTKKKGVFFASTYKRELEVEWLHGCGGLGARELAERRNRRHKWAPRRAAPAQSARLTR